MILQNLLCANALALTKFSVINEMHLTVADHYISLYFYCKRFYSNPPYFDATIFSNIGKM